MAPRKGAMRPQITNIEQLRMNISGSGVTARGDALQDLITFFKKPSLKHGALRNREYHGLLEALFHAALTDKQLSLSGKSGANKAVERLNNCAKALRETVTHGVSKLKGSTVKAVMDHIMDTLPDRDGDFFEPLTNDYIQTLVILLSCPMHVEELGFKDGADWLSCVDFVIGRIDHLLEGADYAPGLVSTFRNSPAPGTPRHSSVAHSSGRARTASQRGSVQPQRNDLLALMQCLLSLVSASNAPCMARLHKSDEESARGAHEEVCDSVLRILRLRLDLHQLHRVAFATLNSVLLKTAGDDPTLGQTLTRELIPLLSYWWQPRTLEKDEMLFSVRDEMLKTVHGIHLYLDGLLIDASSAALLGQVEGLLDTLWGEYSQRSHRSRLRMDDLTFSSMDLPPDHFSTGLFALQPFSQDAERRWALVETMSRLEGIFLQHSKSNSQRPTLEGEQPRKKQRLAGGSSRIRQKMSASDVASKLTALQLIPFFLPQSNPVQEDLITIVDDLMPMISDKQGLLSSWAMIACASCATQSPAKNETIEAKWKQVWQLAVRSVSIPTTCRAACALLNAVLEAHLIPYHDIADDVNNMVTMADICGPAVLLDSSLVLMQSLNNIRNEMVPSASQKTSSCVIRWVFSTWKPADSAYVSSFASNMVPADLINLLLLCCGSSLLENVAQRHLVGGPITQFWKLFSNSVQMTRYLLLLDEANVPATSRGRITYSHNTSAEMFADEVESSSSHTSKTLVLELLYPKLCDFSQMFEPTSQPSNRRASEGTLQWSTERLQSLIACLISGTILLPHLENLESQIVNEVKTTLESLWDRCLQIILESAESQETFELMLVAVAPYMPSLDSTRMEQFCNKSHHLLRLFSRLSEFVRDQSSRQVSIKNPDAMDVDDEFETRSSRGNFSSNYRLCPRQKISSAMTSDAFYESTKMRLHLFSEYFRDPGKVGLIPDAVVEKLLSLEDEQFLLCRGFFLELLRSDFGNIANYAEDFVKRAGEVFGKDNYSSSEVVMCLCLEILLTFAPLWGVDEADPDFIEPFGDLYNFFLKVAYKNNMMSPETQMSLSGLLYRLIEINPRLHDDESLRVQSPRTTLLKILRAGCMSVKFHIGRQLTRIFDLYVVNEHDNIFVDVLEALPADSAVIEGIAFRIFVLAHLGCQCPTLLRRCVYHIVETPGRVAGSAKYATQGMKTLSVTRSLKSPRELFQLFAPQLLYTWLEPDHKNKVSTPVDSIEDIPHSVFDFSTLDDLLRQAQTEAAALMAMRGQDQEFKDLATKLHVTPVEMAKQGFSKIMAYSIVHDLSTSKDPLATGESRIRKLMGKEPFYAHIYRNFADIIALFFDVVDQEDLVENSWRKDESLAYAANVMDEIKGCGHSPTELPANQQPLFKAKYLTRAISHLVMRTNFDVHSLWTPALIASVARRLLNTIHPALGPQHALSVVRKIRVLICLAGPQAASGYPLEMLLRSIRPFISDTECADDAFGISQWLIIKGAAHLTQTPSFLAGYALSTLASLRMFLESSQASTTQESQFKATMHKAQRFHTWFIKQLKDYRSSAFKSDLQEQAFKAIIQSASNIRSSGNSEKHTHESKLLLEILKDAEQEDQLLTESARDLALRMLCGDFKTSKANRDDIIGSDEDACTHGPMVWKSCRAVNSSKEYLTWAGRVVGRSFAASGEIPHDVLRESLSSTYQKTVTQNGDSVHGLLRLLSNLTRSDNFSRAGLAESALRRVVSFALRAEDNDLVANSSRSLPETLFGSSNWAPYQTPPTDDGETIEAEEDVFRLENIGSSSWARDLSIYLALSVEGTAAIAILSVLPSILGQVDGFAEQSLPFIVHLVLLDEFDSQKTVKRSLSAAVKEWLKSTSPAATDNIKLLINVILYLRTRVFPNEASIADRTHWLELEPSIAAEAATRCGMFKVALMFAELASSEQTHTSRRSSAARDIENSSETLLKIFENIDDPDAYYGLDRTASLSNVLARLEYEKEGSKSLAFRGAQYDSHLRRRDPASELDGQSLVKILSSLGLSGLSNSLLQAQQHHDDSSTSLDSTFTTARRLEIWNLPVPSTLESHAALSYRAYQSIQKAVEIEPARNAIRDGMATTMKRLATKAFKVSGLRQNLSMLAALTELDDILGVGDISDLEKTLADFEARSKWMLSGRYDDVSRILSHRETTLSMLSQKDLLRKTSKLTSLDARLVEIRSMLLSSDIYRFHRAKQESLNISTTLTDLVRPSEAIGLNVDAAIKMEEANSLWDYGEMIPSIKRLQGLKANASFLKKQDIPIEHANLLSKIGYQVSVAKLETADSIQKKYLEPALKELKGKSTGKEAGQVFHQFATFCDEQLQDPGILEDLARLQKLVQNKAEEVNHYRREMSKAGNSQLRNQFGKYRSNAEKVLKLDQDELERAQKTRNEFVKLSLENYLQSLAASDDHDNDALRFTALWLERSENNFANLAVNRYLQDVPTRKFAPLMNQLSSRLQLDKSNFQVTLRELVCRICFDHPYHGMYQIWSGTKTTPNKQDEIAVLRNQAAYKVANEFERSKGVIADIWKAVARTSVHYHQLAREKNNQYKSGAKVAIQDSEAARNLSSSLYRYRIPPPTLQIELSADKDYSNVPVIVRLEPTMSIASGVSVPKIITVVASNGERHKQLVKGGNDDLRQDAIMEQVFAAVSSLLKQHRATRQRNLGIRTYKVLPLTARSGLIEFVANTTPLHDWLMPAHEQYYPKDQRGSQCRKEISSVEDRTTDIRVNTYRKITEKFHPVMRYFFLESFPDPDDWYVKRLAYTRSTAAISILGHVLGLGDRHGHNILLDKKTGEVVHIDLGVAFETGRILPIPEVVPFRMTRDIVDGMGVTKTDGVFRRCCEFTLDALREDTYSIMTILDVLRYDPLYSWSSTPMRLAKLQGAARRAQDDSDGGGPQGAGGELENKKKLVNEPSEADRALEVVRKKLSKTLSVTATVNDLINQATDERNLAVLYSGWAAYA